MAANDPTLATVRMRGEREIRLVFNSLEREVQNAVKAGVRKKMVKMRDEMRKQAPVRSGKLQSSIKHSVGGNKIGSDRVLAAKMKWGGKASARAVKRASYDYGARGGAIPTPGRIEEAYYVHMVSKGHPTRYGKSVPPNEWAHEAIKSVMPSIRRAVEQEIRRITTKSRGVPQ